MEKSSNQTSLAEIIAITEETHSQNSNYIRDSIVESIYQNAEHITNAAVKQRSTILSCLDRKLDDILTSRWLGYPIMFLLLGFIFWLTIIGANYPSQIIAKFLFGIENQLTGLFMYFHAPHWIYGILILGIYRCLAWVISVMLPPMAIFFPCFTLLEDLGYLPRIAFNVDRLFKKVGAHGKQALTMSMGFGCNAAGITACRIIESPRERLIAILTNNFVPCNGRFPTLISLALIFMGGAIFKMSSTIIATAVIVGLILLGISITLLTSWLLSKTVLRGIPSSFTLELPPYRKPQIGKILIRSLLDRTLFVLGRAIVIAAPAGAIIWALANIQIGDTSIITHIGQFLNPLGYAIGLDGFILLAFILGLPANEIVLPILIMCYLSAGTMMELESLTAMRNLFIEHGWTWLTALNMMLFSLLHFPCGTTLWTIRKETSSIKWTLLAFLMPTAIAFSVCFITTQIIRLLGLV